VSGEYQIINGPACKLTPPNVTKYDDDSQAGLMADMLDLTRRDGTAPATDWTVDGQLSADQQKQLRTLTKPQKCVRLPLGGLRHAFGLPIT